MASALEVYLLASVGQFPQPWRAVSLQNGFTNYGHGGVTAQYRLSNKVTVEIMGLIESGSTTAPGTLVFTLPAGYYDPSDVQALYLYPWANVGSVIPLAVAVNGQVTLGASVAATSPYYMQGKVSLDA